MAKNLTGYNNILLFGGSFDPPHRAHIALPQQAAQAIGADLIAYIPAGRAPHKLDRVQTDSQHRLAMLRLALADQPGDVPTLVLTDEIERGPSEPSYTVDTLEALHRRINPGAKLRLLIGADQLRIFDAWRAPNRIIELAEPVVMVRPPDTRDVLLACVSADKREAWAERFVDVEQMAISSTAIRAEAARGFNDDGSICDAVADYITQHALYRDR